MTEREVEERLAAIGLPDDIDEVMLAGGAKPDAAALERIRQMTLAKVGAGRPVPVPTPVAAAPKQPWRQRLFTAAAALVLVAAGLTVALGPAEVWARLVAYVPGLGLRDPAEVQLAAAQPVRLDRGDTWVEVRGLLATEAGVSVNVRAWGAGLTLQNVALLVGGESVKPEGASLSSSGSHADGWYFFARPVAATTRRVAIVVEGADPWRFDVDLVPGDQLLPADQFGPSAQVSGYSIAARAQSDEKRLDLNLLVQGAPAGARVVALEQYFGDLPATRRMSVTAGGRPLASLPGGGGVLGELWERNYEPVPAGTTVTVTVPVLEVEEAGAAKVSLPVQEGTINKQVTLGRWSLTLSRVEPDAGGLRIYVDLGAAGATTLAGFGELEVGGRPISWHSKHDEQTGRMTYFSIPAEALGKGSVTLTLKRPIVLVEGPWVIAVPVQN